MNVMMIAWLLPIWSHVLLEAEKHWTVVAEVQIAHSLCYILLAADHTATQINPGQAPTFYPLATLVGV